MQGQCHRRGTWYDLARASIQPLQQVAQIQHTDGSLLTGSLTTTCAFNGGSCWQVTGRLSSPISFFVPPPPPFSPLTPGSGGWVKRVCVLQPHGLASMEFSPMSTCCGGHCHALAQLVMLHDAMVGKVCRQQ